MVQWTDKQQNLVYLEYNIFDIMVYLWKAMTVLIVKCFNITHFKDSIALDPSLNSGQQRENERNS